MKNETREPCEKNRGIWGNYIVGVKGSRVIICLLLMACIMELFALGADLCPVDYWFDGIKEIVIYDKANVIPVVAIAWGAVSVPMGFLLGHIERRNYGIRLVDFLIARLGLYNSVFLIGSFWLQLVFIVISAMYHMPVLLTVTTWTQLLYLYCFFYLVMLSVSREAIQNIIRKQCAIICENSEEKSKELEDELQKELLKKQNKTLIGYTNETKVRHWLLVDMIKNIDYCRFEDVESLKQILIKEVCPKLKGIVGRKTAYDIFKNILSVAGKEEIKQISFDIFSANISDDARKGIFAALISERDSDSYKHCQLLIEKLDSINMEAEAKKNMFLWVILWSMHQRVYDMCPMEKLQNDMFIEYLQEFTQKCGICFRDFEESQLNEIILQSCQDFMMLTKSDVSDSIIEKLFENKV